MRIPVQRRPGLPLDVACQAVSVGKKTRNKKYHDEFGDAAVNVPMTFRSRATTSNTSPRPRQRAA